jgi:hypothetical protein
MHIPSEGIHLTINPVNLLYPLQINQSQSKLPLQDVPFSILRTLSGTTHLNLTCPLRNKPPQSQSQSHVPHPNQPILFSRTLSKPTNLNLVMRFSCTSTDRTISISRTLSRSILGGWFPPNKQLRIEPSQTIIISQQSSSHQSSSHLPTIISGSSHLSLT